MDELVELTERPELDEKFMLVGWNQWADAGSISSGLPQYLVELTGARKIGQIKPDGFYLFQVPGTHHFLRPVIKLAEGHRQSLTSHDNRFFCSGSGATKGRAAKRAAAAKRFLIFLGEEPHLNVERYADAFLDAAQALGIKRIVAVGGVYGPMPYDKDREVSCIYSLPGMKEELAKYAVRFSSYEGGVTIGTYFAHRAEERGIEFVVWYAFVPAYDFSDLAEDVEGMRVEEDYRAWHELLRRINHMFGLGLDLSDLEQRSAKLTASVASQVDELSEKAPQVKIHDYLQRLEADFEENPFMLPLDDVWERELGDLFKDMGE